MATATDTFLHERDELLKELGEVLVPQIALRLLRDGDVSTEGKTNDQIRADVTLFLREAIKKKTLNVSIAIDHAIELLPEARRLLRNGKNELSAVYFATYFEHSLNWLIFQICESKKINAATIKQVLRDTNMRAKCTWVMTLLGHKPFSKEKLRALEEIAEVRNAFIHYKWPLTELSEKESKAHGQILVKLRKAESLVRYLREFENDQLYKGRGRRLRKALKTSSSATTQPKNSKR
ncbi:hypothetical protein HU230_0000160 [Bradyrhizobium quebecense]|uniref:Uncharacterized protein n=1 Tax=Bradyrhizobium quebecense TaxID=2748629 RepID=A0A973WVX1_9BRAD|nr:hypothetical protein [Bradyrhizobium quebecense]UGA44488.1 hypothetical protein HU230_0000160 [Bradyrhizobium quebecense]